MKKTIPAIILPILICLSLTAAAQPVYDESKSPRFLFVQAAQGANYDGKTLTLRGVSNTIYFSDRPSRLYGHMANADFATLWRDKAADSFKADPPNAILSVLGKPQVNIFVELMAEPVVKGSTVQYRIRLLAGKPPADMPACSLFIDVFTKNSLPTFF